MRRRLITAGIALGIAVAGIGTATTAQAFTAEPGKAATSDGKGTLFVNTEPILKKKSTLFVNTEPILKGIVIVGL